MKKLTKKQFAVLAQYKDTSDNNFRQGVKDATELWRPLGLLDWHGIQYGTHFYSITTDGLKALSDGATT